jgi:hypothetical protein
MRPIGGLEPEGAAIGAILKDDLETKPLGRVFDGLTFWDSHGGKAKFPVNLPQIKPWGSLNKWPPHG